MYSEIENQDENNEIDIPTFGEKFEQQKKSEFLWLLFKDDVKKSMLKCGCIVYFVFGFTLSITIITKELDLNHKNGKPFLKLFNSLLIISYFINVLIIIYNHKTTAAKRSKTVVRVKDNLLLYIITLPLSVIAIVSSIIRIIHRFLFHDDSGNSTKVMLCFNLIFVISVLVLMADQGQIDALESPENCSSDTNKATILITIVGLVVSLILFLVQREVSVFRNLSEVYYNVSYQGHTMLYGMEIYKCIRNAEAFLFPIHIAFLAIGISVMFASMIDPVGKHKENVEDSAIPGQTRNSHFNIPFQALILGIIIVIAPIISLLLINSKTGEKASNIIFYLMPSLIYSVGILLAIIQIREMKHWSLATEIRKKFSDKCLVLMGCFGQILMIINTISMALQGNNVYSENPLIVSLTLVNLIFLTVQIVLQNITVELTLCRIPRIPSGGVVVKYCPSVGLFSLNASCLIIIMYMASMATSGLSKNISVNLFHFGMNTVSTSFTLIYRLHGCLVFGALLNEVHK